MSTVVPTRPRILCADDQPDVLEALRLLLKSEGFEVRAVGSPAAVLAALELEEVDAIIMDLNYARDTTSGREGLDLLGSLRVSERSPPVIVMTAWGSVDLAVEAMRKGARDFVQKPWDNARLLATLRTQAELARALRQTQRLEAENRAMREEGRPLLIADAPSMRPVLPSAMVIGGPPSAGGSETPSYRYAAAIPGAIPPRLRRVDSCATTFHQACRHPDAAFGLLLQGLAEIARCLVCLRRGQWPSREADVEEVDVDKLKAMVEVTDEDIAALDAYVVQDPGGERRR